MEHSDKGPPYGGPEGNNHSNVEVVWKFGQILLSVLRELINSQHAPHQSPFHWARLAAATTGSGNSGFGRAGSAIGSTGSTGAGSIIGSTGTAGAGLVAGSGPVSS